MNEAVNFLSLNYENFLMIVDFNAQEFDFSLEYFCDI